MIICKNLRGVKEECELKLLLSLLGWLRVNIFLTRIV